MVTLVTIAPGHQLAPAPAASYERMRAVGCPPGITSSWRSPERQAYLYDGWVRRLPGFAFALPPGSSQHERGYALDLKAAAAAWVRAHPEHGWRFTNRNEWWHVDYFLVADVAAIAKPNPGGVTTAPPAPVPLEPEEDPVRIIASGGLVALLFPNGKWSLLTERASIDALVADGVKVADIGGTDFKRLTHGDNRLHP